MEGCITEVELRTVLQHSDAAILQKLQAAPDVAVKLVNLSIEWLHTLLPHVLSKVHRVSYGLLTGEDLEKGRKDRAPKSRLFLAVPFIGKDRPSDQSEFSQPDVTIGFTIMAFRLNGMRNFDIKMLLRALIDNMKLENTIKFYRRSACLAYVRMVVKVGGCVRGFTEDGRYLGDLTEEEKLARQKHVQDRSISMEQQDDAKKNLWPLEMLDLWDPEQVKVVFDVLCYSPPAVEYLLNEHILIPNMDTIDRSPSQLTASGQELAGPQLFGLSLGFSGTPNELVPKAMGKCMFAKGDDGQMMSVLTNLAVVSVHNFQTWSPSSILDFIAESRQIMVLSPNIML